MAALTIIVLLLLGVGLYAYSRSILHPGVVTCLVWGGLIVLYLLFGKRMCPLSDLFYGTVLMWVIPFVCTSFVAARKQPLPLEHLDTTPNEKAIRLLVPIVLIALALNIVALVHRGLVYGGGNLFAGIRLAAVADMDKNDMAEGLPLWATIAAAIVGGLLLPTTFSLALSKQFDRRKLYIFLGLILMFALLKSNKYVISQYGLALLVYLWYKNIISKRKIVGIALGLLVLLMAAHLLRRESAIETFQMGGFLEIYLLGPLPAFDWLIHSGGSLVETFHGEFTFRAFARVLQLWDPALIGNHDPYLLHTWVMVPVPLNVYTCMMPYFEDFGFIGIACGGAFYGWFSGHLFRGMQQGYALYTTLYCCMFYILVFQFFADFGMMFLGNQVMLIVGAVLLNYKAASCPAK